MKKREYFLTHFLRPTLLWYQNLTRKTQKNENYRQVFLMNIDANILNKILQSQIQRYTSQSTGVHSSNARMVQVMQIIQCDTPINKIKDKNHMVSIDAEKEFLHLLIPAHPLWSFSSFSFLMFHWYIGTKQILYIDAISCINCICLWFLIVFGGFFRDFYIQHHVICRKWHFYFSLPSSGHQSQGHVSTGLSPEIECLLKLHPWCLIFLTLVRKEVTYAPVTSATYTLEHVFEHFLKVYSSSRILVVALFKFWYLFLV